MHHSDLKKSTYVSGENDHCKCDLRDNDDDHKNDILKTSS